MAANDVARAAVEGPDAHQPGLGRGDPHVQIVAEIRDRAGHVP